MALTSTSALRKDRNSSQSATLEHRHFAFIAAVIANMPKVRNQCTRGEIAEAFARACAGSNPRFDYARFLKACDVS